MRGRGQLVHLHTDLKIDPPPHHTLTLPSPPLVPRIVKIPQLPYKSTLLSTPKLTIKILIHILSTSQNPINNLHFCTILQSYPHNPHLFTSYPHTYPHSYPHANIPILLHPYLTHPSLLWGGYTKTHTKIHKSPKNPLTYMENYVTLSSKLIKIKF